MAEIQSLIGKEYLLDVWLPLALPKSLTYKVVTNNEPLAGMRVVVPLKGKKLYTGFIWKVHTLPPTTYEVKHLLEVVDQVPFLSESRRRFLEWLSSYYCCTLGEVLAAAVPSPFRLSSESYIQIHPDFAWQKENWDSEEHWIFTALQKNPKMPLFELLKALGNISRWMKKFRKWQAESKILIFDELMDRYRPRMETFISLHADFRTDNAIDALFVEFSDKPQEESLMLKFLSKTRFGQLCNQGWHLNKDSFPLSENEKKTLTKLSKKGIFLIEKSKVNPYANIVSKEFQKPKLSNAQSQAILEIEEGHKDEKVVLLMGVTGSGKTEIYIHLITNYLEQGRQCLLMLPEIAISVQMVSRLKQIFGDELGVYHSKATLPERMEVWEGVESGVLKLVVGVRSSVFLPFQNLGLLIADEEHDSSYKQTEPAPRYHGRDAGIFLAHQHGARVLLGSATPSTESYFKAKYGKWRLVKLLERFGGANLPDIQYVDMKLAERTLQVKLDFSTAVIDHLALTKTAGKQSIVFQNRRGYSPFMQCKDCGWIPYCPHCDVSLTYHQAKRSLNCHYCGHKADVPRQCLACGSVQLQTSGYGTEKLEESLMLLLPDLRIARMDQDTTQSRKSFEQLLARMRNQDLDILLGTQMVTKGLDFENVTFVAVFDVDRVLHYPDFRANERTFQLLSQISGRAGRRQDKGLVMIQTNKPYHPIYSMIAKGETILFYEQEILHRRDFTFPPFAHLIKVTSRHIKQEITQQAIEILAVQLRGKLGSDMVLGPEEPVIARLRNQFIFNLMIKIPLTVSAQRVKEILAAELKMVQTEKVIKAVQWIVDVDPY